MLLDGAPSVLLSSREWPELEGQSCVSLEPRRLPRGHGKQDFLFLEV